ncbi:hypothetical protein HDU86_007136 [Geranomyces michiganensis]|nr:hypothetical protein HDU86_007136 [Geranomyces michiganensis]
MQTQRPFTVLLLAIVAIIVSLAPGAVHTRPASGPRTLVILEKVAAKSQFSTFLNGLQDRGYDLQFKSADDSDFGLIEYDENAYDHVLVLAPTVGSFGGELGVGTLLEFVNKGGNVLIAASSKISEAIRDFAYEFSADFDEAGSAVFDHFNQAENSDENGTLVAASNFGRTSSAIPTGLAPVLFRGVGHRLTGKNPLMQPLLVGAPTTYAYEVADTDAVEGQPLLGEGLVLVSALQARNNARVVFTGSVDMFGDDLINQRIADKPSGNGKFVDELAKWTFQEKGVLRVVSKKHHRENETAQHGIYRIKDDMVYEITIAEWTGSSWEPFTATDLQFEAVMLDPYIRTALKPSSTGKFSTHFRLPDHYGVFTFKVDYRRHGRTWVTETETVQIRPYRHDQYPRFLTAAMPYYTNVFSLAAAFVLFSAVFLWNREVAVSGKKLKAL